jgi:hypothetical protein
MGSQSDLNAQVEAHLRAIWKGSSVVQPTWTPEQVRARATRFEAHARRLALGDLAGFLLVPAIILGVLLAVDARALAHQPFGRIQIAGAALLVLCSVVGLLASRHSYVAVTSNANDLLASHLERLSLLRDWYASTPWGAALYLPGAALVMIGVGMNPAGAGWERPIIWTGVASFAYLVACVQTRLKARALQREIDSLEALRQQGVHPRATGYSEKTSTL